jgi:putative membrane protein
LTTATTATQVPFRQNRFVHWMCAGALVILLAAAYRPETVFDWALENATAGAFLLALVITYRRLSFSDASYVMMLIFLAIHEWGAHYKYSDVPLGEWMKSWLHTNRNHYDRVAHFSWGLLVAYPAQEIFMRKIGAKGNWLYLLPVETILAMSAVYEMLEAFMAQILSPQRGEEFVGMQGDIWDSQKDMFDAAVGSVVCMGVVWLVRRSRAR